MSYLGNRSDDTIQAMGESELFRGCFREQSVWYICGYRSRGTKHEYVSLFVAVVAPTVLEVEQWWAIQTRVKEAVGGDCTGPFQPTNVVEPEWETAGLFNCKGCFEECGGASSGSFEEVRAALGVQSGGKSSNLTILYTPDVSVR
jgi:hypothetical protein